MESEIPAVIAESDVNTWSDTVDVLIVGCGIAGASAALEAAARGARVLVIERSATPGGTTMLAGGHFYLGGGTAVQVATGHHDSPEEMEKYITAVSLDPNPEKIRAYCEESVSHFDWLEGLGFEFERSFYPDKAVIQPGTQGLMYTGNEKVWPFCEIAIPAPRGHKVPVVGDTGGARMVIGLLVERLAEAGVEIRCDTGARNLITDDSGCVVGVGWKRLNDEGAIRATGVVIAAGGFVMNEAMVEEFVPELAEKPYTLGTPFDDGLGIRLGASVGGQLQCMEQAFVTAPVYPPAILVTGLIVNKNGDRFVAEDSYHSRTSGFVLEQAEGVAYLIVDEAHIERPRVPLIAFIDGWETVADMESALGIPTGRLQATMLRYNANAARGLDPDFHKRPEWLAPQDTGPWAAFDLSLGKAFYAGFTMGGLATSVNGEVLGSDGAAIPGLYAAGAGAVNIAQDSKGYASGTQLGEGSYFGRRAGRHAASIAQRSENSVTGVKAGPEQRQRPNAEARKKQHEPLVVSETATREAANVADQL